jgi:hypothetical protein
LEVDVDSRDNMEITITKWKHISKVVMANFHFHHHHNRPTYKDKWGSFYGDYKKTHDYQNVTCHNEKYWNMSIKNKVSQGLSKNFNKVFLSSLTSSWIVDLASTPHIQDISWIQMMMSTMRYFFMILHHVKIWGLMNNSIVKRP